MKDQSSSNSNLDSIGKENEKDSLFDYRYTYGGNLYNGYNYLDSDQNGSICHYSGYGYSDTTYFTYKSSKGVSDLDSKISSKK